MHTIKTKAQLKECLLNASYEDPLVTNATSMVNGGTHRWWVEKASDGDVNVRCFGSGPGWQDQTHDDLYDSSNIAIYVDLLWKRRAEINSHIRQQREWQN